MNRAQALSKLNRSDMRNAAAERGMQRLFTWNRAHWIGMVVLIAVLLLLQWSSSIDRKSTRLNSSHITRSRMPSSA